MGEASKAAKFPAFSAIDFFGGGWRVLAFAPGKHARLEQARAEHVRGLGRLIAVLVFCGVFIYFGVAFGGGGARLVTLPLVVLCGVVFVLGLASLLRTVRRARHGVKLELDARQQRAIGFPDANRGLKDYAAKLTELPLSRVRTVKVALFRAGPKERLGRASGVLTVDCGELTLQGPTVQVPDEDWRVARDRLGPLALELARIAKVDVVLVEGQDETLISADQISALPLPESFEVA